MTALRGGFKSLVGVGGGRKKESRVVTVLTYLALAAAVALLVYKRCM